MSRFSLPIDGRRVLFVGGKGGVGKTTVASAVALRLAEEGEQVLLVSTDPAHSLGDLFGRPLAGEARTLAPRLSAIEIDPEAEVERYLASVRGNMKAFVDTPMFPEIDRHLELTRHSPGATEAALLDRLTGLLAEEPDRYDRLVFDTAPTGHTLRLLALPELMQTWTEGLLRSRDRSDAFGRALGRLGGGEAGADEEDEPADPRARRIREILLERSRRFARARRVLLDADTTAFVLVLVPERLPILESRSAVEALGRHGVPIAGMVVNRVLPEGEGGTFLARRRAQEARYLEEIDRGFRDLPKVRVPLLEQDVEETDGLREVARHL